LAGNGLKVLGYGLPSTGKRIGDGINLWKNQNLMKEILFHYQWSIPWMLILQK
jgi:hypothetical protein